MFSMDDLCCTPLLETRVTPDDAGRLAARFKALADPARIRLLSLIADRGEVCGCELVGPLDLSQPTVSHHLKVLTEAGFLQRERRGKWIHYRVDEGAVEDLRGALRSRAVVKS
jgi:ArsR family transcriptional regulator